MTLDDILEQINQAEKIVILTHENPDGDAMGSSLAMYHALKNYGKNPDILQAVLLLVHGILSHARPSFQLRIALHDNQ